MAKLGIGIEGKAASASAQAAAALELAAQELAAEVGVSDEFRDDLAAGTVDSIEDKLTSRKAV